MGRPGLMGQFVLVLVNTTNRLFIHVSSIKYPSTTSTSLVRLVQYSRLRTIQDRIDLRVHGIEESWAISIPMLRLPPQRGAFARLGLCCPQISSCQQNNLTTIKLDEGAQLDPNER